MVISDHAGAGNQTLVPGRTASALNHTEGIILLNWLTDQPQKAMKW